MGGFLGILRAGALALPALQAHEGKGDGGFAGSRTSDTSIHESGKILHGSSPHLTSNFLAGFCID